MVWGGKEVDIVRVIRVGACKGGDRRYGGWEW